jgi:hypothetical protein
LLALNVLANGLCGVNGAVGGEVGGEADEEDEDDAGAAALFKAQKTKSMAATQGSCGKWSKIAAIEPQSTSLPHRILRRAPVDPLNVSSQ